MGFRVSAETPAAVRQAEHAMWDAEVVAAIGKAATIIPDHGLELDARAHDEGLFTGKLENLGGVGGDL